jgi:hypothetical protein
MLGAMLNSTAVDGVNALYLAQPTQGVNSGGGSDNLAAIAGGSNAPQASAAISGPGELLSNLQQLQAQDPTKFQQVVSQIAGQLQTAAQQTQGPLSSFLSNLGASFQNVASGGNLSQLQPQQQHHHHHHAQQAYNQSQNSQSQGVAGLAQSSNNQSSSNSTLQQLLSMISSTVNNALAG